MILRINEFRDAIDDPFWKKISKDSLFPDIIDYKDIDREEFLIQLARKINNFEHHINKPYYYYSPKSKGVLRKIKLYTLADTCIYYYCVRSLQKELVNEIKRTKNVYGGFRFTPDLKMKEQDLIELECFPTEYEGGLSKIRYRKEWSGYERLAKTLYDRRYDYYIHIDIAHFYDDINLDILENKIRDVVNGKSKVIDLLFNFLRLSDKTDLGYNSSSVGVPQEDVGEMSRLLANFYLATFDASISKYVNEKFKDKCFYTRYADDMWFCINGEEEEGYKIVQEVSSELNKLKLHINEKKLVLYRADEFAKHWLFGEVDKLKENKNADYLLNKYREMYENKEGRWFTPALYALIVLTTDKKCVKQAMVNSLFSSYDEALEFINSIIKVPKFLSRLDKRSNPFFKYLLDTHLDLKKHLQNYLFSKKNIYPNVEYYILELLVETGDKNDFDFFYKYYRKAVNSDYQWYSRCICLKYLINHTNVLDEIKNRDRRNKLKKHMGENSQQLNRIERRYVMRFLLGMGLSKGNKVLDQHFNTPEDKAFLEYLKLD